MKNITRILMCSAIAFGLSGCFATASQNSTAQSAATPASVIIKADKSQAANANTFNLYVGSTQKGEVKTTSKKGKRKQTTTIKQDVPVQVGDATYYTSGAIVANEDVRNAFVAKTIAGEPALGIRLSDVANNRLSTALAANESGTVLASLNSSVFSKVNNAGAKLQDGVLLLPMASLNQARDVAELLRKR